MKKIISLGLFLPLTSSSFNGGDVCPVKQLQQQLPPQTRRSAPLKKTASIKDPAEKADSAVKRYTRKEIIAIVRKEIVEKLGVKPAEVIMSASFTNDLGADSLDTVELIMEFESRFKITIPDDQAELIGTVGQAVNYLYKQVGKPTIKVKPNRPAL